MYVNPLFRYRTARMAWSFMRYRRLHREFAAKNERLISAEEFVRLAAG